MKPRVGCAVLAAGSSSRLGFAKQLLRYEGVPLVQRAVDCGLRSRACATLAVLGAHAESIRAVLNGCPVELRENAHFSQGLASSLRVAALWAIEREWDALVIALCDQPFLTERHLDALIGAYERSGMLVASRYAGQCGVPALFPLRYLPALLSLRGDQGARALLRTERPLALVPWPEGELDVDTQAHAERLQVTRASLQPEESS